MAATAILKNVNSIIMCSTILFLNFLIIPEWMVEFISQHKNKINYDGNESTCMQPLSFQVNRPYL
jgi:hypothetical protein